MRKNEGGYSGHLAAPVLAHGVVRAQGNFMQEVGQQGKGV